MPPHSDSRDLEQYVDGKMSQADSFVVRSHLEECEACHLRLADIALDVQLKGPERRSEPRIPVRFPGRLKLVDRVTSVGPPHDIEVVEISRSGMKVRSPRFLITKTLIQIHFNGKTALGDVRYCLKADSGYYAGIKLVKDFPGTV